MKNIIFDMETGDPDDLITLLMLLINPHVNLKAVTCYEGSPTQIGLIKHVTSLSGKDIPVAGWNTPEKELSSYYSDVVGSWSSIQSTLTPVQLLLNKLTEDTELLTGAPLTNISQYLNNSSDSIIVKMTTQGGYLGNLVPENKRLEKFKNRKEIRTYNLTNDTDAFNTVNYSTQIKDLTYVTKDLCHGFLYTREIHESINFKNDPISQLLKKALAYYSDKKVAKAMHDPLAMLFMLYPEIGTRKPINMSFRVDKKYNVFSSLPGNEDSYTFGLIEYDYDLAWNKFKAICSKNI
jgi:pyrimidine-specific ribonucleoside hydrolase